MHKRAFQAPKRTFMHVSGLPPTYFEKKKKQLLLNLVFFFNQNTVGKDLRQA